MEQTCAAGPQRQALLGGLTLLLVGLSSITAAAQARQDPPPTPGIAGGRPVVKGQNPGGALDKRIEDLLARGDSNAARKLVPEFLAQPRVPADTLLRTGVALAQHDLYAEAAEVFGRSVKDFPSQFEGYYNLALAELALKKYSEALATLAQAPHGSQTEEVARTYLRGKTEMALGKNAEAERDFTAAFTAAPQEENYALDLGLYYIRAQKYQEALAVFEKATRFEKGSPFLLLGLGLAQFLGGQSAESIETCRSLLALQPRFSPARVMMAFGLYMRGNIDEAEKVAAQGLHDPNPLEYLYYLHAVSLLKLQSKDYNLILNDLTLAAQAIPRCSLCYLAMSKVHQRRGEEEAAAADLEKAVGLDPTFAEAWYRLAALYDQAGRHEAAQQARQRFEMLKEDKADRDTEMLRGVFVKALGGEGSP